MCEKKRKLSSEMITYKKGVNLTRIMHKTERDYSSKHGLNIAILSGIGAFLIIAGFTALLGGC